MKRISGKCIFRVYFYDTENKHDLKCLKALYGRYNMLQFEFDNGHISLNISLKNMQNFILIGNTLKKSLSICIIFCKYL